MARFYCLTFRLELINETQWLDMLKTGKRVLLCTWHQQFFAAIRHFKNYAPYHPGLMISQSKDGELISGVARLTGWHTPRGSSSRGGKEALGEMIAHLQTYGFGAHILDGPRGPIGKVKPGIVKMAMETCAYVVPFTVEADHSWFFNSWDRFMLPKPFSRVKIRFYDPISFTPDACDFETCRQMIEDMILPGLCVKDG